jgi:hypothetical protein
MEMNKLEKEMNSDYSKTVTSVSGDIVLLAV